MTAETWQLKHIDDIDWTQTFIFRRKVDNQAFKCLGYNPENKSVTWVCYQNDDRQKITPLKYFSSTHYEIRIEIPKEQQIINKIKELNERYLNRRASL